jgi:hypothetical protein
VASSERLEFPQAASYASPFIMYYLTFLVLRARELLEAQGFGLETQLPLRGRSLQCAESLAEPW